MPDHRAAGAPSELRPPPPRLRTPLPATFALREDAATRHFDEGSVMLGGSPLRLLRFSERARDLVARWAEGVPVGTRRPAGLLARRVVDAGAFVPRPTSATLAADDVTVVIPVRDRPRQLDRLLGALEGLSCVVVDDASPHPETTKEIAERHGARFLSLAHNVGPAGARNAGLALVQSELVAFVDSDCVPAPDWLEPLLGHFDDPVVAAVAPRIVSSPERAGAAARYQARRTSLDRGPRAAPVRPGSPVPFVPSAALLVRTAAVNGPDLFDPTLRGGEDVDVVWRLTDRGWDVRYVPESTVEHDAPATVAAFLARRAFYGSTAAPLSRRHPGALAPVRVSGWSAAVWALALARRPVAALAVLAASVGILAHRLTGLVRDPVAVALRIAGFGTVRSALPALAGLTRAWSPAFVAALAFRRTRAAAAAALVLPALGDWAGEGGGVDPLRYGALHVADDVAYGIGVWAGCVRAGTAEPLIPRIVWRSRVWSARALQRELVRPSSPQPAGPPEAAGPP